MCGQDEVSRTALSFPVDPALAPLLSDPLGFLGECNNRTREEFRPPLFLAVKLDLTFPFEQEVSDSPVTLTKAS